MSKDLRKEMNFREQQFEEEEEIEIEKVKQRKHEDIMKEF